MTIKDILSNGMKVLNGQDVVEVRFISRILLSYILKCKSEDIVINLDKEIDEDKKIEFFNYIEKVSKGYPVQYIIGKKEFMKMEFIVSEDVLIPRADTEILVEEVIEKAKGKKNVLDMCTGSGIIAVSLAKYCKWLNITATDISEKALKIALENSNTLLEEKQIKFIKSDLFENINEKFDIIVSNPPYIKSEIIKEYNLQYEPYIALNRWKRRTYVL